MRNEIDLQYLQYIKLNELNVFLKKLNSIKQYNNEIKMEEYDLEEETKLMELSILIFKDFSLIKKRIKDKKILALLNEITKDNEEKKQEENDTSLEMQNIFSCLIDSLITCAICYLSYEIEKTYDRKILQESLDNCYQDSQNLKLKIENHYEDQNNITPIKPLEYNFNINE